MFPTARPAGLIVFALAACGNHGGTGEGVHDDAPPATDAHTGSSGDASTACGMRTGMRSTTNRTVMVGTTARTYIVYLPSAADPSTPMPFVYVFHGYTMSGQQMYDITQYT